MIDYEASIHTFAFVTIPYALIHFILMHTKKPVSFDLFEYNSKGTSVSSYTSRFHPYW